MGVALRFPFMACKCQIGRSPPYYVFIVYSPPLHTFVLLRCTIIMGKRKTQRARNPRPNTSGTDLAPEDAEMTSRFHFKDGEYVVASSLKTKAGQCLPLPSVLGNRNVSNQDGGTDNFDVKDLIAVTQGPYDRKWQNLIQVEAEWVNSEHTKRLIETEQPMTEMTAANWQSNQSTVDKINTKIDGIQQENKDLKKYADSLGNLLLGDVAKIQFGIKEQESAQIQNEGPKNHPDYAESHLNTAQLKVGHHHWLARQEYISCRLQLSSDTEVMDTHAKAIFDNLSLGAWHQNYADSLQRSVDWYRANDGGSYPATDCQPQQAENASQTPEPPPWIPEVDHKFHPGWDLTKRTLEFVDYTYSQSAPIWPETVYPTVRKMADGTLVNGSRATRRASMTPQIPDQLIWGDRSTASELAMRLEKFTHAFKNTYREVQREYVESCHSITFDRLNLDRKTEASLLELATEMDRWNLMSVQMQETLKRAYKPVIDKWTEEVKAADVILAGALEDTDLSKEHVTLMSDWVDIVKDRCDPKPYESLSINRHLWQGPTVDIGNQAGVMEAEVPTKKSRKRRAKKGKSETKDESTGIGSLKLGPLVQEAEVEKRLEALKPRMDRLSTALTESGCSAVPPTLPELYATLVGCSRRMTEEKRRKESLEIEKRQHESDAALPKGSGIPQITEMRSNSETKGQDMDYGTASGTASVSAADLSTDPQKKDQEATVEGHEDYLSMSSDSDPDMNCSSPATDLESIYSRTDRTALSVVQPDRKKSVGDASPTCRLHGLESPMVHKDTSSISSPVDIQGNSASGSAPPSARQAICKSLCPERSLPTTAARPIRPASKDSPQLDQTYSKRDLEKAHQQGMRQALDTINTIQARSAALNRSVTSYQPLQTNTVTQNSQTFAFNRWMDNHHPGPAAWHTIMPPSVINSTHQLIPYSTTKTSVSVRPGWIGQSNYHNCYQPSPLRLHRSNGNTSQNRRSGNTLFYAPSNSYGRQPIQNQNPSLAHKLTSDPSQVHSPSRHLSTWVPLKESQT